MLETTTRATEGALRLKLGGGNTGTLKSHMFADLGMLDDDVTCKPWHTQGCCHMHSFVCSRVRSYANLGMFEGAVTCKPYGTFDGTVTCKP